MQRFEEKIRAEGLHRGEELDRIQITWVKLERCRFKLNMNKKSGKKIKSLHLWNIRNQYLQRVSIEAGSGQVSPSLAPVNFYLLLKIWQLVCWARLHRLEECKFRGNKNKCRLSSKEQVLLLLLLIKYFLLGIYQAWIHKMVSEPWNSFFFLLKKQCLKSWLIIHTGSLNHKINEDWDQESLGGP